MAMFPHESTGMRAGSSPLPQDGPPFAAWGTRVGAYLIDLLAFVPFVISGATKNDGLQVLFFLAGFAFYIYQLVRQGTTGQTIGKRIFGIRLLREQDGQPVGAGLSIGRYILHAVDSALCGLGYLWPLWDEKKQTFADKILDTVVVKA